jgi:hypothetical protein
VNGHQQITAPGLLGKGREKYSFAAECGARGGCTETAIAPEKAQWTRMCGRRSGWCSGCSHTFTRGCQGQRYHFPHGERCALRSHSGRTTTQLRPALTPSRRPRPGLRCRTASSVSSAANRWLPHAEALRSTRHCPFMHSPLSHILYMRCPI